MAGNVTGRTIGTGPLSSHSSIGQSHADCLSLRRHERSALSRYLPRPQENTPHNRACQLLHSLFPLHHLSSFPSEVTRRGYPRRKCLSSEGGACACCLSLSPHSLLLSTWSGVLSFLRNGVLVADNRMPEELTRTAFLTSFLANPIIVVNIA